MSRGHVPPAPRCGTCLKRFEGVTPQEAANACRAHVESRVCEYRPTSEEIFKAIDDETTAALGFRIGGPYVYEPTAEGAESAPKRGKRRKAWHRTSDPTKAP